MTEPSKAAKRIAREIKSICRPTRNGDLIARIIDAELREEREAVEAMYNLLKRFGVDIEGCDWETGEKAIQEEKQALAAYRKVTGRE